MQLLHLLSVLVFGLLVSAQQSPLQKELEIKTTYTPSDCNAKAKKGDAIKVHYVRSQASARLLARVWCVCRFSQGLTIFSLADRKTAFQWQQV